MAIPGEVRLPPRHVVVHTEFTLADRRRATTGTFKRPIRRTGFAITTP